MKLPEPNLINKYPTLGHYTTPPAAQPEPLEYWNAVEGWVKIDEVREHFNSVGCGTIYKSAGEDRVPLYTAAQRRPWQGLTEEDWAKIEDMPDAFDQGVAWAAARLKERNT